MTKEQIVGLGVRLFAIFLAIYTLRYSTGLLAYARMSPPDYISLAFTGALTLIPLLIALLLWIFPLTVAGNLIPHIKRKTQSATFDVDRIGQQGIMIVMRLSAFIVLAIGVQITWNGLRALLMEIGLRG